MAEVSFKLPDIGEGIAAAEVTDWHVAVGDVVQEDAPLVDVMTDKATVEISAPFTGRVIAMRALVGEMVPVGSELVVFETDVSQDSTGAPFSAGAAGRDRERDTRDVPAEAPGMAAICAEPPTRAIMPAEFEGAQLSPATPSARSHGKRTLAAPAVRQRAYATNTPLESVAGSGPEGRITHADLDRHLFGASSAFATKGAARRDGIVEIPIAGLRRRIAERMQHARLRIPHFSYIEEVDVTALEDLRASLNNIPGSDQPRLTLLPFLVRAVTKALLTAPALNAHYDDDAGVVRRHEAIHAGIATQTPAGLLVPVLRYAEDHDLWSCAREIRRLADAARNGKSSREELSGSTITITSLGALGGLATTPVINPPEVAIVGVNKIVLRPVVVERTIVARKMMNLSASFDHRVVDGWVAAEFIQRMRTLLEQPALLFIEHMPGEARLAARRPGS